MMEKERNRKVGRITVRKDGRWEEGRKEGKGCEEENKVDRKE
jgi:hypothetical protein